MYSNGQQDKIGAIGGIKLTPSYLSNFATTGYAATQKCSTASGVEDLTSEDKNIAIRGLRFTQPDTIPDGLNKLSGGSCGGILNLLGFYNDDGIAPQTSWTCIA
ncbi:MAG: hypothetical protein LKG27_07360 [Clostridiaceae bacterium]|jgi:hypothetical protein|nr:hypothetical protein [Clostridiaceae bacterium]